jgi:hypothetical protein
LHTKTSFEPHHEKKPYKKKKTPLEDTRMIFFQDRAITHVVLRDPGVEDTKTITVRPQKEGEKLWQQM